MIERNRMITQKRNSRKLWEKNNREKYYVKRKFETGQGFKNRWAKMEWGRSKTSQWKET
jgi:hypothetical protein